MKEIVLAAVQKTVKQTTSPIFAIYDDTSSLSNREPSILLGLPI